MQHGFGLEHLELFLNLLQRQKTNLGSRFLAPVHCEDRVEIPSIARAKAKMLGRKDKELVQDLPVVVRRLGLPVVFLDPGREEAID